MSVPSPTQDFPTHRRFLEARNLTMRYGDITAINGISFRIHTGEVVALLGPNGAGKSTTMRVLTGYLQPSMGAVTVHGHDLSSNPIQVRRKIGYLPEAMSGYGELTCAEFLRFITDVRSGQVDSRRAEYWIMDILGLHRYLNTPLRRLSKGWQQRAWLAQALVHDPDILILDEPTDGLDPRQKQDIRGLIAQLAKQKAILMSTHILEEAESICQRAIILQQGRIVADTALTELLDDHGRLYAMYYQLTNPS